MPVTPFHLGPGLQVSEVAGTVFIRRRPAD